MGLAEMTESGVETQGDATAVEAVQGARVVTMSAAAVDRVKELLAAEDNERLMLRIFVSGGGCSGFQYGFSFDDSVNEDDLTFEYGGVTLAVDETSLDLLGGSEVDWVESLAGAAFQINNPNASSSCGCGSSFSV